MDQENCPIHGQDSHTLLQEKPPEGWHYKEKILVVRAREGSGSRERVFILCPYTFCCQVFLAWSSWLHVVFCGGLHILAWRARCSLRFAATALGTYWTRFTSCETRQVVSAASVDSSMRTKDGYSYTPRRNDVLFRRCIAATVQEQLDFMLTRVRLGDSFSDAQITSSMDVAPAGFDWATYVSRQEVLATVVPMFLTSSAVLMFGVSTDDDQLLLEPLYHMDGEHDAPPLFCVHMMPLRKTVGMSTNLVERAGFAVVVGLLNLMAGCRRGLSIVH